MIAASEPLEFIPRGRQAVEEHPGPSTSKQDSNLAAESVLLQRMQSVNISVTEEQNEYWKIREIYAPCEKQRNHLHAEQKTKKSQKSQRCTTPTEQRSYGHQTNFMCDFMVNSEEELYVKKHTAVWTRGFTEEQTPMPRLCFTCETPIKFAFFCNKAFAGGNKSSKAFDELNEDTNSICLIDQSSLRVYRTNGEDFMSHLEFPVSNVWPTCHGVLLEKVASTTVVHSHTISMPRLFSLSHPLNEICPVLFKSAISVVSYLIESEYCIIYSGEDVDLLLLYDTKIGKHFIARLRTAEKDEINSVGTQNDTGLSGSVNQSMNRGTTLGGAAAGCSFLQSSMKYTGATPKHSTTQFGRTSFGTANYSTHISKFLSSAHSTSGLGYTSRVASPYHHLQSSFEIHSISVQDLRKVGQSQPSKPILPELCLEHIWTENNYGSNRDFCEISTSAFIHTDLAGETYLCYLRPRAHKLQLVRLNNYGECDLQISTMAMTIAAKDAVCLPRLNMIAVLDPSGALILYTGTVLVSKVHVPPANSIGGSSTKTTTPRNVLSPNISFPRRSSLLPSVQKHIDSHFEDELHLLSPVHPLQSQFAHRLSSNVCLNLRDPAGNRLTLVYPNGRMYRISLPHINETKLVTRCIQTLRQILPKDSYLATLTRWYGIRNPPGSHDYSIAQEWKVFKCLLKDLMGCSASAINDSYGTTTNSTISFNAEEPKKRRKNDEISAGTNDDWIFMESVLKINNNNDNSENAAPNYVDTSAVLFTYMPAIFFSFHLLYEDFKLDVSLSDFMPYLAKFLNQLAVDMQLSSYMHHYALDYPQLLHKRKHACLLTEQHGAQMLNKELLHASAPSLYAQVEHILYGHDTLPYIYIEGVNDLSRNVLQIISLIMHGQDTVKKWITPLEFPTAVQANYQKPPKRYITAGVPRGEQIVQMLLNMGITRNDIERMPVAIHLIIAECLEEARISPPIGCTPATYELIHRSDLVAHAKLDLAYFLPKYTFEKTHLDAEDSLSARCPPATNGITQVEAALDDGMDNIDTKLLSLRFPADARIAEVRRLLSSSEPVLIDIQQSPGTSDHEFIEEQEKQLFALCTRTMTLPLGRGMLTMRTSMPTPTESMPIPKLCLSGKEPLKGAAVEMQQIEFPANMNLWPTFHNGVAAGLKISPHARDVDSTWIVYNKPKIQMDISTEHAGFLMALGLNGHLKTLSFMSIYEYLVRCDEMTSVGLLLGISATHKGTMNNTTTKLLSVHIEALLPATALELDIPQNIQVASLMGIGLLYQGTAKRHIAEVLLQEVGRPPGPEMENSVERESYALTAGLALGLVTLGHGESAAGLRDLQLPDTLHYYMVGGVKRPLAGAQKEKYKLPSFQVREGENVNIDVTAPGATLALGLMFFNTGNHAVAEWMRAPDTKYLLDLMRPDMLLLRIIARGLILWSDIQPTEEWLFAQFPENLRFDVELKTAPVDNAEEVDHEAVTQAYCNIIAGAAFTIGLKYAGTCNPEAFKGLRRAIELFMDFNGKYVGEFAGRTTVESSLMLILISISLVFAGSGDLDILRIIRYLRSRIGVHNPHVTYGSQMAIHMSLGLLYLGAGRFTVAKTPEAVAALVCAFFPKFPIHSNDNRYHLQAFRHLYVLAVEPRLFLPRDIDTKKLCLCKISVLEVGSTEFRALPMAPCMLPELSTLQKVIVDDPSYWPVCFEKSRNWSQLVKALENSACIDIKKRMGCLSHLEDPDRLKTLYAQTLTTEQHICWRVEAQTLERFSSEPYVIAFTDRFLQVEAEHLPNAQVVQHDRLTLLFYNAVIKDKMHVLPIYLAIIGAISRIEEHPTANDVWQIKLTDIYNMRYKDEHILFSKEIVQSNIERFKLFIERAFGRLSVPLRRFLTAARFDTDIIADLTELDVLILIAVINFYNLTPSMLSALDVAGSDQNYIQMVMAFRKLNLAPITAFALMQLLQQDPGTVPGKFF